MEGRRRLLAGEISSHTMEKRYIRKDGSIVWGKLHRSVVRDENNQPQYLISVLEEITERILAEHALKESEQRLSLALSAGLGVWDCDLRTKSPGVSPQYTKFFGHPPRDPAEWLTLVHPDDRERVLALVAESLQRTREWGAEFRLLCPDGSVRWMLSKAVVIPDSAGQPARMLGVSLDITNRKETETALRQAELLNKQILDIIPDCIFVLDVTSDGRFRFVSLNPAEEKAVGLTSTEVSGKFVDAVLPEEVASKVIAQYRRCLEAGTLVYYEDELNLPVGLRHFRTNLIPVHDSAGGIHRIVGCCVDLTEVRCAQEEALARQKLESMGVLAGGIAHDFNNLLGGIIASAELAMKASADGSPLDDLRRIRTAAIRGGEIVRQLMIYGGKESPALEPVDLSLLIEEMLELLKVSISKHAVLKINLSRDLPGVEASPTQIRQVVMNLITNASEAIGERDGVISISTASVAVGQHPANLPENNYLQLEVSDTGVGMTPEVQTKIFDPFFTTKFPGRGLGLAVVRGIVRDHRGAIEFASVPGRGTTCLVWLPCTAKMTPETRKPTAPVVTEKIEVPAATVLMVEDEDLLRIAVSKGLRRRGFSVLEASDGSAAVELIHAHPAGIDIVLLDVTLPGMSSREILEEVARMQPHPKVILTSAYSKEAVEPSFAGLRVQRFIRKPFQLNELVDVLREAISE
jgi:PAS domain S-box-containing protein